MNYIIGKKVAGDKMGDFGIHLYENDFALDIKGDYEEGLAKEIDNVILTQNLINHYSNDNDIYYQMMFWVILADVQWKYGRLMDKVKKKALYYLDDEELLDNCLIEVESLKEIRKKELLDVRERLVNGTAGKKKVKQLRLYRCEWSIGDVFEYQLHMDASGDYKGYYIYFVKCGEEKWYPGHVCPVVYLYAGVFKEQKNLSDLDGTDYLPLPLMRACDNIETKFNYRILLISTSKRIIPQKYLKYIGNSGKIGIYEEEDSRNISYGRPVRWKKIEDYFIETWKSWKDCFDSGKMIKSEILKFKGRISRDENYVRVFYSNSDYKVDYGVHRYIFSEEIQKKKLRIFPFLWSFSIIVEQIESHDSDKWNGARYRFLYYEAKDMFYGCEERKIRIPKAIKDCIYIDIYDSHYDHLYYCDYSENFLCASFYDKIANIYAVGNPDSQGECIEFTKGQYALINDTKLVAIYIDLNKAKGNAEDSLRA